MAWIVVDLILHITICLARKSSWIVSVPGDPTKHGARGRQERLGRPWVDEVVASSLHGAQGRQFRLSCSPCMEHGAGGGLAHSAGKMAGIALRCRWLCLVFVVLALEKVIL